MLIATDYQLSRAKRRASHQSQAVPHGLGSTIQIRSNWHRLSQLCCLSINGSMLPSICGLYLWVGRPCHRVTPGHADTAHSAAHRYLHNTLTASHYHSVPVTMATMQADPHHSYNKLVVSFHSVQYNRSQPELCYSFIQFSTRPVQELARELFLCLVSLSQDQVHNRLLLSSTGNVAIAAQSM